MSRSKLVRTALRALAVGGVAAATLAPGAALAQTYPDPGPPAEPGTETQGTETQGTGTSVAGTQASRSTLPVTGGDIVGLAVIGAGAAATGGILIHRSRRARA